LLLGLGVFLLWAFPGYMSTDSAQQLVEARTGKFSDGHPPLMAAQWKVLDLIVSGPLLMLLWQVVLFLGGLYVLLKRFLEPRVAAWAAIGVLLFPPVLTPMAAIWKDSQMAAYLLAGTAAMLQPRLRTRLVGVGLLAVACALRHNAFAAVVPLVFFLFEWRAGMRWWKRTAIVVGAALFAVVVLLVTTRVLAVKTVRITPAFQDIVGVIALSEDKSDEEVRHLLRGLPLAVDTGIQERCRYLFELGGAWRITQGETRLMDLPATPEQWAALDRAWKELVADNPGAYFAVHGRAFRKLLGISDAGSRAAVYNLFLEKDFQMDETDHNASASRLQVWVGEALYWLDDNTPLFRPWLYAVIGLLLLALYVRDRVTAGLVTSGFLYELSFFPVGVEPDYRYSHWMITCVVITAVIVVIQRRKRRRGAA
jgi:hypothetical protein